MNPVLFLDFDGVMHSEPSLSHEAFTQMPLVEAVLREFPTVEIVISSAWRLDWPEEAEAEALAFLRLRFSLDIAPRVVGVTPDYSYRERSRIDEDIPLREYECLAWLKANRPAGTPWLALDDRADFFSPDCLKLMTVDGGDGFMASDEETFRKRLAQITQA